MSQGRHAADDRSLGRSTSLALGRGALLVGAAVVIGVVLLHTVPTPGASPAPSGSPAGAGTTVTTVRHRSAVSPATTATSVPRSQVSVLVANGTSVGLGASHLSTALGAAGYHVLTPTNTTQSQSASAVYFVSGYADAAAALATLLQLGPSTVQGLPSSLPVPSVAGADIVVVEGPNLAQRFASSSSLTATTGTPSTTAGPG